MATVSDVLRQIIDRTSCKINGETTELPGIFEYETQAALDPADLEPLCESGKPVYVYASIGRGKHRVSDAIKEAAEKTPGGLGDKSKCLLMFTYNRSATPVLTVAEIAEINNFLAPYKGLDTVFGFADDRSLDAQVKIVLVTA